MTSEQIEKFLHEKHLDKSPVRISFKVRKPFLGIFIKTADYDELKSKNFWRIVGESNIDSYKASKNTSLARIYSGMEITRLSAS
jgi:hypothetical protein